MTPAPRRPLLPPLWLVVAMLAGIVVGLGWFTFVYAKGYSYFLDDPTACTNCHAMRDNYDLWTVASHRTVTCNGCHTPHGLAAKYAAEARNGVYHSYAFTFGDVQAIRITPFNRRILQENCETCHAATVDVIQPPGMERARDCADCHRGVGHGL